MPNDQSNDVNEIFGGVAGGMDAGMVGLPIGFFKGKVLEADFSSKPGRGERANRDNVWLNWTVEVLDGQFKGTVEQWSDWCFERKSAASLSKKMEQMAESNRDIPLTEDEQKTRQALGRFKEMLKFKLGFDGKPGYEWLDKGSFSPQDIGRFLTNVKGMTIHFQRRLQRRRGDDGQMHDTDFKENRIVSRKMFERETGLNTE